MHKRATGGMREGSGRKNGEMGAGENAGELGTRAVFVRLSQDHMNVSIDLLGLLAM